MTPEEIEELKTNCYKALTCLYLATADYVADDVNKKVKAYIKWLEEKIDEFEMGYRGVSMTPFISWTCPQFYVHGGVVFPWPNPL